MSSARFQFYEVVWTNNDIHPLFLRGKVGAVIGMAQDKDKDWSYAIFLFDLNETR